LIESYSVVRVGSVREPGGDLAKAMALGNERLSHGGIFKSFPNLVSHIILVELVGLATCVGVAERTEPLPEPRSVVKFPPQLEPFLVRDISGLLGIQPCTRSTPECWHSARRCRHTLPLGVPSLARGFLYSGAVRTMLLFVEKRE